jgi:hypothetical protein
MLLIRLTARLCLLSGLLALAAATGDAAEHVIHISVDGLGASYLQAQIDAGKAPNFKRFETEGAWTLNARTDYTYTITLPNHTSMITGRPVTQPTGMPNTVYHGWTSNTTPSPTQTLHNSGNPNVAYKASTFDVVHDAGLSTALYASKTKFILYEQSYNAANGAAGPYGKDKIDQFYAEDDQTATMQSLMLSGLGSQHFSYTFVHYANPDTAGHSSGWGGTAYNAAVQTVDGYLGQLFNLVETDPVLAGHTAIVLSADHGGSGTGHSDVTLPLDYTIPFLAWGEGVAHGDFYSLNVGSRANPGTARITYTAAGQPIRNGDGGNLALSLLGLGSIPGSLIDAAQDLRVAMPGDYNGDGAVDGGDLAILQANFGAGSLASAAEGDTNGDYRVDGADFLALQRLMGGGGSVIGAPEPSSDCLAMTATIVALVLYRRLSR